jgi:probable HAF family extracellular repeat protein
MGHSVFPRGVSPRSAIAAALVALLWSAGGGVGGFGGVQSAAAADATELRAKTTRYRLTDLGTIAVNPVITNTDRLGCLAINDKGDVTGSALFPSAFSEHAFLYRDGIMQDLGSVTPGFSAGCAINDKAQLTGYVRYVNPQVQRTMWHAFLFSHGAVQDLGLLVGAPFHAFSVGYGINQKGQVTGYAPMLGDNSHHAFIYTDGVMRDLGTLAASRSEGRAINDRGQVTGSVDGQAFLYNDGDLKLLGAFGGASSAGYAINNKGEVTGSAALAGDAASHAFVYRRGVMQDLGCLNGDTHCVGLGINERGTIVGTSGTPDLTSRRAFVYSDGAMRDLNDLLDAGSAGWHLHTADGINRSGQIVGKGLFQGSWHAFVLTPKRRGD